MKDFDEYLEIRVNIVRKTPYYENCRIDEKSTRLTRPENTTDEPNSMTYFKVLQAFAKDEPVLPTLACCAVKHAPFRKMQ